MIQTVVLLIVASMGYQPIEYGHTRQVLEAAGIKVMIASDKAGIARTGGSGQFSSVAVDMTLDQINPNQFDGIFIVGGPGALQCLDNPLTHKIMQQIAQRGKAFGAICIAPRILAKAGLLDGKKATGWNGDGKLENVFTKFGVERVKKAVVTDGVCVTADGPSAANEFGKAIVEVLKI